MRRWRGLAFLLLLVGCNAEDATPLIEQGFTAEFSGIEKLVKEEKRIQDRQLVAAEDIVLVTYETKPEYRVQKQRIERDLKKQLEKAYPSLQFVVSGDFKLHYEAQQLVKKEHTKQPSIKKEIEQLSKLAEEET